MSRMNHENGTEGRSDRAGTPDSRRDDYTANAIRAERAAWEDRATTALFVRTLTPVPPDHEHDATHAGMVVHALRSALVYYWLYGNDPVEDLRHYHSDRLAAVHEEAASSLDARISAEKTNAAQAAREAESRGVTGRLSRHQRVNVVRERHGLAPLEMPVPSTPESAIARWEEMAGRKWTGESEPRRHIECGALRPAQPGDNHDGGQWLAGQRVESGGERFAGCHLDASHVKGEDPTPHDFSPLPDVEHVDQTDLAEVERRSAQSWSERIGRTLLRPVGYHSPICNGVDCAPSCNPIR